MFDEICFMAICLDRFQAFLRELTPPPVETLVELRLDLSLCTTIIANKCSRMLETSKAVNVEHFGQSNYATFYRIDEIVGRSN